jgi:YidC/Oxa1 family membrane protein insertase
MQDIQPELKKLQKQHKDNKEQLNKEIAELYKTKGINPLGCVLPLIIQMPVWFALFRVLREPLLFIPKEASLFTQLGDHSSVLFFTMDLQIPASEISTWIDRIPYLVLILFVILTALYQQSQLTKKSGNSNNPQAQQMQMIGKIMPLFFGFISWTLPSGLVVYFLTGNIFRIGQQALIVKIEENQQEKTDKKNLTEEDNKPDTSPIKDEKDDPRKNRKKRRRK